MCCFGYLVDRSRSPLRHTLIQYHQYITVCDVTYGCFPDCVSKSGTLQHSLCAKHLANTHVDSPSIPGKNMCLEMKLCQMLLCVITWKVPWCPSSVGLVLRMTVIPEAELEKCHGKHSQINKYTFLSTSAPEVTSALFSYYIRFPPTDTLETFGLRSKE